MEFIPDEAYTQELEQLQKLVDQCDKFMKLIESDCKKRGIEFINVNYFRIGQEINFTVGNSGGILPIDGYNIHNIADAFKREPDPSYFRN